MVGSIWTGAILSRWLDSSINRSLTHPCVINSVGQLRPNNFDLDFTYPNNNDVMLSRNAMNNKHRYTKPYGRLDAGTIKKRIGY